MKKATKRKTGFVIKVILISLLTLSIPLLLFLYAVQAQKYTTLTTEVSELEERQEKLIEENKRLVNEISILSSAERIEKIASEELKMHKAQSDDIIRVEVTGEKK